MRKSVNLALYNWYSGSCPALAAKVNAFRHGHAYPGDRLPYVVYGEPTGRAWGVFRDWPAGEDDTLQFDVWSKDPSAAEIKDIKEALCDCFDDAGLAISDGTQVCLRRTAHRLLREEEGGSEVWHYVVSYRLMEQESS